MNAGNFVDLMVAMVGKMRELKDTVGEIRNMVTAMPTDHTLEADISKAQAIGQLNLLVNQMENEDAHIVEQFMEVFGGPNQP